MNFFDITLQNFLIFSAFIILLFIVGKYKVRDFRKKILLKKRFERGALMETKAKKFLVGLGYSIVHEQYACYHRYKVNGVESVSKLILDYVVSKGRKQYIVEVKSGKSAIYVKNKDSRRQLLEYDFVLENDGVFLLDMENENMQLVEFFPKSKQKTGNFAILLIIAIAITGVFVPNIETKTFVTFVLITIGVYVNIFK